MSPMRRPMSSVSIGFGASAPYQELYEKFGITADAIAKRVRERLAWIFHAYSRNLRQGAVRHSRHVRKRGVKTLSVRVAINGFGRIGRNVLRAICRERPERCAGRRDQRSRRRKTNAHLLRYDSVHGKFDGEGPARRRHARLRHGADQGDRRARCREPALGRSRRRRVVMECTGIFTKRDAAAKHLEAGAKKVLISAPGDECRSHRGLRRQSRSAGRRPQGGLERVLHHQLPGPGRQGAERYGRYRARPYDHDPLLHQRSGACWIHSTRISTGPAAPPPR